MDYIRLHFLNAQLDLVGFPGLLYPGLHLDSVCHMLLKKIQGDDESVCTRIFEVSVEREGGIRKNEENKVNKQYLVFHLEGWIKPENLGGL